MIHVLKLGGSLLDLTDLPARLTRFLAQHAHEQLLLVLGGGDAADLVRAFDKRFGLTPHAGHWCAIRAMQLNAHLWRHVFPTAALVTNLSDCHAAWARHELPLLDPIPWLENEARAGLHIPHRWSFTSDSIAAHLATQITAQSLTLLKSTLPPPATNLQRCADLGIIDPDFPTAAAAIPHIHLVNLRTDPPARHTFLDRTKASPDNP